jgi:hypothetical protein
LPISLWKRFIPPACAPHLRSKSRIRSASKRDFADPSLAAAALRATPAIAAVITGTGYGYVREDGIAVIPIGALAP